MKHPILCLVLLMYLPITTVSAQPPLPGGADDDALKPVRPGSNAFRGRFNFNCTKFFRELDGTCTNDRSGLTKLWGSSGRPQFSYFEGRSTREARGRGLRSPRQISNILSRQTKDIFDERGVAEIAVFFGQFIDHTLVATPLNEEEPFPIQIPKLDFEAKDFASQFDNGTMLPFFRSNRVKVRQRDNDERASNSLSSAMDLTNVYGPTKQRLNYLRTGVGAKLATSEDGKNLLPKNGRRLNNAPNVGPEFFVAGDHRANEHPVLTSLHILFMREHNRIADEINEAFPEMSEEMKFSRVKKINEAQFQRIVFEEWYPEITGRQLPAYRGYRREVDPTVSLAFSTAGFRVGHTMVGDRVKRRGRGNSFLPSLGLGEIFFQSVGVIEAGGIEEFLRGSLTSRAQRVDLFVHDVLRNHLFTNITGEGANFDLVALNIQRGRDHALPSYNALRRKFHKSRRKAVRFGEISTDGAVQRRLQAAYTSVGRVEAFPGLLAEDHESESSFGSTLLSLWSREFQRIRNGDRLYFRRKRAWPPELLALPRVKRLLWKSNFRVLRRIILDNTNITRRELPRRMFRVDHM